MSNLLNLLPALALLAVVMTGVESVPAAVAHRPAGRSPHEHHRHLAARAKVDNAANAVPAQKRALIRRKADGTQCRVKGGQFSASSASSASSAVTTSSATPSSTTAGNGANFVQVTQVSTAVYTSSAVVNNNDNNNNNYAQAAPTTSAAAQTSAAAAAAPVVQSGGSGANGGWKNTGSKFGLAWPNGDWAQPGDPNYVGNYIGSKASWYYTWSPWKVGSADSQGLEFVPMLWGPKQVGDWWAQQSSWPSTVKNALFFNEPNEGSQSNMAVSDSISYWMNDMVPLRKSRGINLGGAAPTNAPSGLQWILDFANLCTQYGNSAADCKMDFVPIHWYYNNADNFKAYVQQFHAKTGLDIWVTEYACHTFAGGQQCDSGMTWQLHQEMAAWFDTQDYVKRYAPFGVMKEMQGVVQDNALMNPDGSITALGNWYIWNS